MAGAVGALAVAALALLLAGCGTVQAGAGVADHPAGSPSPAQWHTYVPGLGQIVSVRVGGTGRVLAVGDMMPTGRAGCERDLTGKVAEFAAKRVYLTITFQSRLAVVGPCSWRVVTVGAPPPASCSPSSYGQAMGATGPPMDAAYGVLGCDGRWLALNVGWPGGASGCDGPSCSLDMVSTYWFFRATPRGWDPIAASRTAGCARVHKAEPQFPARLCAALPALPG